MSTTLTDPAPLELTEGDRLLVSERLTGTSDAHVELAVESLAEHMGLDPDNDFEHYLYLVRLTTAVQEGVRDGSITASAPEPHRVRILGQKTGTDEAIEDDSTVSDGDGVETP